MSNKILLVAVIVCGLLIVSDAWPFSKKGGSKNKAKNGLVEEPVVNAVEETVSESSVAKQEANEKVLPDISELIELAKTIKCPDLSGEDLSECLYEDEKLQKGIRRFINEVESYANNKAGRLQTRRLPLVFEAFNAAREELEKQYGVTINDDLEGVTDTTKHLVWHLLKKINFEIMLIDHMI